MSIAFRRVYSSLIIKASYKPLFLLVPRAGIEPAREKLPRDFKSLASTNSATPAEYVNG